MGSLSFRTPMGHRARGLLREWKLLGTFSPRSCTQSRLSLGRDGLLGFSDRACRLCFALALWNEKDPILKERLFGLTGPEGNHGEDVKEQYFYLAATPTYSYAKALYKYPQSEFPYTTLVEENRRRNKGDPEFEISIPASLTRTVISMSLRNTRKTRLTTFLSA